MPGPVAIRLGGRPDRAYAGHMVRGWDAGKVRQLGLLALLMCALVLRVGPFCAGVAVAALPAAGVAGGNCHDALPDRPASKPHPAGMAACATPCIAIPPAGVEARSLPPLPIPALVPAPARPLAGLSDAPEAPPPRSV